MPSKKEYQDGDDARITAASREYTFSLIYFAENDDFIRIWASRCPFGLAADDSLLTFYMDFRKDAETGKKYITWQNFDQEISQEDREVIEEEVTSSLGLRELASKHFGQIVCFWEGELGQLLNDNPENGDLYRSVMMDLEYPRSNDEIVNPFGRAFRSKHVALVYGNSENVNMEWKDATDCKKYLYMPYVSIKFENFKKLKAARVFVRIGKTTEEQIVAFLQRWKEGKTWKNFEWCVWHIANSDFNVARLWNLLGHDIAKSDMITSRQCSDLRTLGRLYATEKELRFFTDKEPEELEDCIPTISYSTSLAERAKQRKRRSPGFYSDEQQQKRYSE